MTGRGGEVRNLVCEQEGQKPAIIAQDGTDMNAHGEVQSFALACAQHDALEYLGSARMPG